MGGVAQYGLWSTRRIRRPQQLRVWRGGLSACHTTKYLCVQALQVSTSAVCCLLSSLFCTANLSSHVGPFPSWFSHPPTRHIFLGGHLRNLCQSNNICFNNTQYNLFSPCETIPTYFLEWVGENANWLTMICICRAGNKEIGGGGAGADLGFCHGGCTVLADLGPPPPIWIWIRIFFCLGGPVGDYQDYRYNLI